MSKNLSTWFMNDPMDEKGRKKAPIVSVGNDAS